MQPRTISRIKVVVGVGRHERTEVPGLVDKKAPAKPAPRTRDPGAGPGTPCCRLAHSSAQRSLHQRYSSIQQVG